VLFITESADAVAAFPVVLWFQIGIVIFSVLSPVPASF